jgi:hypothetical protein
MKEFYGFSTREVQKIFPEAVKAGQNDYLTLTIYPGVILT